MIAHKLNPILNVSSIAESIAWFEKLGWRRGWDWGSPPTFGGVCCGACEIFLCENGQGGRDTGVRRASFGAGADEAAERGVWMSIWVDDVDALYRRCIEQGIEVTFPPADLPWGVRELHVRHPDGHVLRMSRGIGG
jgi:catechol 2,3-dioxygenase-like lactoylglutathione lyase family enzyme